MSRACARPLIPLQRPQKAIVYATQAGSVYPPPFEDDGELSPNTQDGIDADMEQAVQAVQAY